MTVDLTRSVLFFGTFNPVHNGHLLMAETVLGEADVARVVFIPAFDPPHRQTDTDMASFAHRLAMLRLACEANPSFHVSDIESTLPKPSYTLNTVMALYPEATSEKRVPILMGADALTGLGTWHRAVELIDQACFYAIFRAHYKVPAEVVCDGTLVPLTTRSVAMPSIGISASAIRQRCQASQSIRYQTPDTVVDYIDWNRLYR